MGASFHSEMLAADEQLLYLNNIHINENHALLFSWESEMVDQTLFRLQPQTLNMNELCIATKLRMQI